jgi:hypothetical protein
MDDARSSAGALRAVAMTRSPCSPRRRFSARYRSLPSPSTGIMVRSPPNGHRGSGEELVGCALDEAPHDVGTVLVGHPVEGRHELVVGVERQHGEPWVLLAGPGDVDAALGGENHGAPSVGSPMSSPSVTTASDASTMGSRN